VPAAGPDGNSPVAPLQTDSLPGYEVICEVHRGGQGVVYKAHHKATDRLVAIKVMREGPFAGWRDKVRFEREVRILSSLQHPSIVAIHDSGSSSGCQYFVMDYIAGQPLELWMTAEGRPDTIDTRTDVYALGVLLYQMLTGRFPYDVTGPMREVLDRIVHVDPVRPRSISGEIETDLEAIVLKSLRKEPALRYQTAGELARDLRHYLNGEPIEARSDHGLYVFRKLVARHRLAVIVATICVLVIATSLSTALTLWRQSATLSEERRQADYANRIAWVDRAWEDHEPDEAAELLQNCPTDLRGWEWRFLNRICQVRPLSEWSGKSAIAGFSLSGDGRLLATAAFESAAQPALKRQSNDLVLVRDTATGRTVGSTLLPSNVVGVAFSPTAHRLAVARENGTIYLWDAAKPEAWNLLCDCATPVQCIAFSPDGHQICAGTKKGTLAFFDAVTGDRVQTIQVTQGKVGCIAYHPLGKQIAVGETLNTDLRLPPPNKPGAPAGSDGSPGHLTLWNLETASRLFEVPAHEGGIISVAFSPPGDRIATGGTILRANIHAEGTAKLFDARSGEQILSLHTQLSTVGGVAFSPTGQYLATAGQSLNPPKTPFVDRTCVLWDIRSGRETSVLATTIKTTAVAWTPDGNRVVTGGMDGSVRTWPADTQTKARLLESRHGNVLRLEYSPNGRWLASSGGAPTTGKSVTVWDPDSGEIVSTLQGHTAPVLVSAWHPDGIHLATGSRDRSVRIWNVQTGNPSRVFDHAAKVRGVAFNPAGDLIACAANDEVIVRTFPSGDERLRIRHASEIMSMDWSPNSRWIAIGGNGAAATIQIIDAADGTTVRTIPAKATVNQLRFSPSSTRLAAIISGEFVPALVYDARTGKVLARIGQRARILQALAFSPDESRIALVGTDQMLRIWDVNNQREVYCVRAHDRPVFAVIFSPDGEQLATGGMDGLIKIWDARPRRVPASGPAVVEQAPPVPGRTSLSAATRPEVGRAGKTGAADPRQAPSRAAATRAASS
jgi:WD40 repeat protein